MKYISLVLSCLILCATIAAYADDDSPVILRQMSPDSILIKPSPPPAPNTGPSHVLSDQLTQVLKDYKISQIGRANQAVSSQYGGQPIVDNPPPSDNNETTANTGTDSKKQDIDKAAPENTDNNPQK